MFYEGIDTNVFRRSIAFAIALVVTSRSSSFEYTMSVHAVHAGAERNVILYISETIQIPHIYFSYDNMHSTTLVVCTPGPCLGVPHPLTS